MKNLNLELVSPFFPHKVKAQFRDGEILEIERIASFDKWNNIKLILRPLSDLINEIEIDGKKFIPIVKLMDLSVNMNWSETDHMISESGCQEWWCRWKDSHVSIFGYNKESQYFYNLLNDEHQKVYNQKELFNHLYKWHFDVDGLIDKGIAIDINKI